jgi:hypothetical protein
MMLWISRWGTSSNGIASVAKPFDFVDKQPKSFIS